jgi:hypothetical protein
MPKQRMTVEDAEDIELRWKLAQAEEIEERLAERRQHREQLGELRKRQLEDFQKAQADMARKQRVCRHRKGGKNNNFANGSDNNYSVIRNTYPLGREVIMCTRCQKEVERPDLKLRKTDPEKYKLMLVEWNEWSRFPTDNSPSGGKVFEVVANVA